MRAESGEDGETPDTVAPDDARSINDNNSIEKSNEDEKTRRERKLTEKGKQELIRKLKENRTAVLSASSKLRTKLTGLMSDEENLHLVKSSLSELDELFERFQLCHSDYAEHITSTEDKDKEDEYLSSKQSTALEYRNQVLQWIQLAESRLTEKADSLLYPKSSRSTTKTRQSRRSSIQSSISRSRERERIKLAEMMAEKTMLRKKQEIQAAAEELELETNIAKSQAREQVYAMMEKEEEVKDKISLHSSSILLKSTPLYPAKDVHRREQMNIVINENISSNNDPIERDSKEMQERNDAKLDEQKTKDTVVVPDTPKDDKEVIETKSRETLPEQSMSHGQPVTKRNETRPMDVNVTCSTTVSRCNEDRLQVNASTKTVHSQVDLTKPIALSDQNATNQRNGSDSKVPAEQVKVSRHANDETIVTPYVKSTRNETDEVGKAPIKQVKVNRHTDAEMTATPCVNPTRVETDKRPIEMMKGTFYTNQSMTSSPMMHTSAGLSEQSLNILITSQLEQQKQLLLHQQTIAAAMKLPQAKVPVFKGDIVEYKAFVMAFDSRIKPNTTSDADRLYYLHQHLMGEPKNLIEGCLHVDPEEGYNEARRLLDKEYGDPYKISVAYTNQLIKWPSIKYDDAVGLKQFSLFLVKCKNAMRTISYMEVLNHTPHMQAVIQKLPAYLQSKWREEVLTIQTKQKRNVDFSDIVRLVDHASTVSNDPIYSKEALSKADERPKNVKLAEESKRRPSNIKVRAGSLATSITSTLVPHEAGSSQQQSQTTKCVLCEKSHDLDDCKDFVSKSLEDRKKFLTEKSLCFACYGSGHRSKGCTNKKVCKVCNKPHPTALHIENFTAKETKGSTKQETKQDGTKVNSMCTDVHKNVKLTKNNVILQAVLPVKVSTNDGKTVLTYALYDNGSNGSFITEQLKEELNVNGTETVLQLGTMHGKGSITSFIVNNLVVTDLKNENAIALPQCYTRYEIPVDKCQIPTPEIVAELCNLSMISEEIPKLMPELEVGLLIGSDCPLALEPLEVLPSEGKGPFAMRLRHGWTLNGPLQVDFNHDAVYNCNAITVKELESIKEVMTPQSVLNMFELDFNDHVATAETASYSKEDLKFLDIASQSIRYSTDGHYVLPLPFREPDVVLPYNREQAVKRANWQRKKMLRDEKYHDDYTNFINDTIERGYARKVPEDEIAAEPGKVWYIPHHGVYHPKKPDKIRVVYDCSAKYDGVSINDTLLQGPNLTNSLVGVLTRFRQDPVAFMADVEQMFYQVRIPENQYNFFRFLWWPEGDLNADLQEYQMTVHLFGAISSPSCASFALRQVCDDNESDFDPQVTETIRRNFYVDDCLRSVEDKTTAAKLIQDVRQACAKGGFNLTKFVCNDREVLESIPQEQRSKEVKTLDLQHCDLPIERALGVQWCVESDKLKFRITVSNKPLTRRGILSTVSSVYDPLGIAAPFILIAKKILQDLCRDRNVGWDTEIPDQYLTRWERWRTELPMLEALDLDRCVKPAGFGEVISQEVHVFSDASGTGYGAVAYLRQCNAQGRVHCSFLMGKARLAPVKTTTIPRLELTAATVAARIGHMLKSELDGDITTKYHTDSTTVLRYLANQQTRFKVFVANRVQTVLNLTELNQWKYVGTKDNPADDASRGLDGRSLLNNGRWLNGPEFLWKPVTEWPEQPDIVEEVQDDPEVKRSVTSNATLVAAEQNAVDKLIHHFSSWYRLKKAVAVFLRVKKILQQRLSKKKSVAANEVKCSGPVTVKEVREAEIAVIKHVQAQAYSREIQVLNTNDTTSEVQRKLKKTSSIYRLDPFFEDGIIRVGGRLNRADLSEDRIHPTIIPKDSHVTTLLIEDVHRCLGHAGRGHVLSTIREKYWIVSANATVRRVISKCVTCRRLRGKPLDQKMADLPTERVTPAPPFTFTGVDYFGPYIIKDGRKEVKRYGALFTCLASRAVHIEIANSLDTDSFIQALRRFIARRGAVKTIRCDNGTNFVGAQAELKQALKEMDHDQIREKLLKQEIEWTFNPPSASNMGGIWERQIRTTRKVLAGLLSEHGTRIDDESLRTLMCEVEAIINSRPLTFVSTDVDDLQPLTPNHLLTTKSSVVLPPPGDFQKGDVYLRRRWRRVQYLANVFWSRWKKEYLTTLQQRCKWQQPQRNLVIGDVVLVKDDNAARNTWCMAVVETTEQDSHGLVRAVTVKTKTSSLRRPSNKLVLLVPKGER